MSGNDDTLRERFAALRREEAAGAPASGPMLATSGARRSRWRLTAPAWAGLAAAAVLVVLAGHRVIESRADARAAAEVARALGPFYGAWRSPTDALLDTPASRTLAATPAVGPSRAGSWPMTPSGGQP